jgi:hypothetical protein
MGTVLEDVIKLGCLALQSEDLLLRAASHYRDKKGGIIYLNNEKFHQYVIWRAIHPMMDAFLEEQDRTDLIVKKDGEHFFELKNWRTEKAPDVSKEMEKLRKRKNGYLIVTTIDKPIQSMENRRYLEGHWKDVDPTGCVCASFATEDRAGEEVNFWMAGWPLRAVI